MPISSTSSPAADFQSQSFPSHSLQTTVQQHKGHLNVQVTPASLPQSTQIPNIPLVPPLHSQPSSLLQPQLTTMSSQLQQSASIPQLPLQPPLPPQPRPPPSMPTLPHQFHTQMGPNFGFQRPGAPQRHHSQAMFHPGTRPPASISFSFLQGQHTHPSEAPTKSLYEMGGSHIGTAFSSQVGNSMQVHRQSAWMPGLAENTMGVQLPGLPPFVAPTQMGPGSQPPRPPPLSPEMEKALLQQVMSLPPEQIDLLPPEQRHQVLQLQQTLRL